MSNDPREATPEAMELLSLTTGTGDFIKVSVAGYEFPKVAPENPADADWLLVFLEGHTKGQAPWSTRLACLAATDIRDLVQELEARLAGLEPAVRFHPLEPHLDLAVTPKGDGRFEVEVQVGWRALPAESEPPAGGYLTLKSTASSGDLEQLVGRARAILDRYPVRDDLTATNA